MRDDKLVTEAQRSAFDEWVDCLRAWQRDVGVDPEWVAQYPLTTKFADTVEPEIGFGRFAGRRKWERVTEIPDQEIRDELLRLIVIQADPEIRSVEQSRHLLDNAPTEHDRQRLLRHMAEEIRHGWQPAYLMVMHFGEDGRREARALLERRATRGEALIGLFNLRLNWVEVFSWHNWGDRLGKYQLKMLAGSAFAPLARSIPPMLQVDGPKLYLTDPRFNRHSGPYKGQPYDPRGLLLTREEWNAVLPRMLPTASDEALLGKLLCKPGWLAPPRADAQDAAT